MHRSAILLIVLAFTTLNACPAAGAGSPLWGRLEPGPYAVGFRQIEHFDHSRLYRLPVDLTGRAVEGERSRPLRISIWYPAEPDARPPLTLGEYIEMIGGETVPGELGAAERDAGRAAFYAFPLLRDATPEQRQRLEALPSRAVRDARPMAGRFPLVLYSLGSAALANVTPEYLASHGYVVAQAPRVPIYAGQPIDGRDRGDLEAKIRDLDFVLNSMADFPSADVHNLAAIGFSAGGRWALSMAMKNWDVKAVVSLDSVMLFDDVVSQEWRTIPLYNPDWVRVPVLHLVRREWVPQETSDLWSRMRFADRTHLVYENPGLDHLDFQSVGYAMTLAGMRTAIAPAVADTFHQFNRLTLAFLDAHVKGDGAARALLARGPEAFGATPRFVTASAGKPLPAPWTEVHFFNAIDQRGAEATLAAYRRLERESSQPPLPETALNLAGYVQLLTGRVPEAIELFRINVESFPRSANALDSLADAYLAAGDRTRALELTRRARALLDADSSVTEERRARIRQSIEDKLRELEKEPEAR